METVPNHPRPAEGRTESILSSDDFTVIAELAETKDYKEWKAQHQQKREHQSEAQLEAELIETLKTQGYDYLPDLTDEAALIRNLREQLERLNTRPEEGAYGPNSGFHFTDEEFNRLLTEHIARSNDGILEKAKLIQEERFIDFRLKDGTLRNIMLIDAAYPARNRMQVVNQYRVPAANGKTRNRYDVTILVNGLPLVHIELKKRSVGIQEAFQQIERYQGTGFQKDEHRFFEYAQIFVISNGVKTKYYSNTVRHKHIEDLQEVRRKAASGGSAGKSFEFTSYWADAKNNRISDLMLFARTFLAKNALANILTRYCIFTVDQDLLVMRPYQIAATERIINCVEIADKSKNSDKTFGTKKVGGYIWHTTGSGKTLTSFKTARRLAETRLVDKVIFVVDRKDLDYQTMLEYNNFQANSVSSSSSTRQLSARLADRGTSIVVTTIHKLSNLTNAEPEHPVYKQRVAIIFDECHRSQFGQMNANIKKYFKNYCMFGFTGTPIFDENSAGGPGTTTVEVFGECLHSYTVVDAIRDKNVLPFHLEYTNTSPTFACIEESAYAEEIAAERAATPDAKELEKFAKAKVVLESPERIEAIATYILDNYDRKTNQKEGGYDLKKSRTINKVTEHYVERVRGFNSILATSSIDAACTYYDTLNALQEERIAEGVLDPAKKLKVAVIYSQGNGGQLFDTFGEGENYEFPTEGTGSRMDGFLEDYNTMFGTNFSTDGDSFDNYYKDVSRKMKMRELDLLIVVNMFLTGFDSKTVNTLWVDKNLKMHGLVQAYSRTNRILNSLKPSGNIVCFRDLEQATKDAFTLFGDTENSNGQSALAIAFTRPYKEAYAAYDQAVSELREEFPIDEGGSITVDTPEEKARYIEVMNKVLELQQELRVHDEFIRDGGNELISDYDMQGYTGVYNDIYEEARELRREQEEAKDGADNETGEGEEKPTGVDPFAGVHFLTELVKQQEVGVLYILELVKAARAARHGKTAGESGTAETAQDSVEYFRDRVHLAIRNDADLRESGDIIEDYFDTYLNESEDHDVQEHFHHYVTDRRTREEDTIVKDEELDSAETQRVVNRALKENRRTIPGKISRLVKGKISLFGGKLGGAKTEDAATKAKRVKQKLEKHIVRFMPFLGGE